MLVGMVRIENHQNPLMLANERLDLAEGCRIRRAALYKSDIRLHSMALNSQAIVWSYLNVNANDTAVSQGMANTRMEDQGPAVSHPGLHDDVRLHGCDGLLDADQVIGKLNDRPTEPRISVYVFLAEADP